MVALGLHVIALHPVTPTGGCACGSACAAPGKHPRTRRWQLLPDPESVLRSDTGYGVRTGRQRSGAHLVVIDCDGVAPPSDLPPTLTVETGRGHHLYYRSEAEARSCVRVREGVDVRGTGGYVVGPWSHHASGKRYVVTRAMPPVALPEPWLSLVARPPAPAPSRAPVARADAYRASAVRGEVERVRCAQPGSRNTTLFSAAHSLLRMMGESDVADALVPAARACGLADWEIMRTIRSAARRRAS